MDSFIGGGSPIAEKYERDRPFLGAVLAGVFTKGSLDQLKSVGFEVIYLPYETIINAFKDVGVDARFDEGTPDRDFLECVQKIESLSPSIREKLKDNLLSANKDAFDHFFATLKHKLDRIIDRVVSLSDVAFFYLSGKKISPINISKQPIFIWLISH